MSQGAIAIRYARALADVAAGADELARVREELERFVGLLERERPLRRFLENPAVPGGAADAAIGRVTGALAFSPLTTRFLQVVLKAGRLPELPAILNAYAATVDDRLGRLRAEVTSAVPLGAETVERIRRRLSELTGKQVYLETRQDPSILAGLITRIGSEIYDGGLKTGLRRLREALVR